MVKNLPASAGDAGDRVRKRSPGRGNANPLQYSCLENSVDSGAWQATVHGVTKSRRQLGNQACTMPNSLLGIFNSRTRKFQQ